MPTRAYMSVKEHGLELDYEDFNDHIVLSTHEDTMHGHAEIRGLVRELSSRFKPSLFSVENTGCDLVLLSSSASNEVLAFQDELLDYLEQNGLLNDSDYENIVEEAINEYWDSLELNERIEFCLEAECSPGLALEATTPDDLRCDLESLLTY